MIGHAIDVNTRELTRALKRLHKTAKGEERVYLRCVPGKLTISVGNTSETVSANRTWSSLVSAPRRWVKALAEDPIEAAITDLLVQDGKLVARNFRVPCTIHEAEETTVVATVGRKVRRAGS